MTPVWSDHGAAPLDAEMNPRRVYISGEQVEIWENPDLPFRCTPEEINDYVAQKEWVLLFNALVLSAHAPAR